MVTSNRFRIAHPDVPLSGTQNTGFGHEGGIERLQIDTRARFVSRMD